MAAGVDIGTCFLVSAKQDANGEIKLKSVRDSFLDLDNEPQVKNMLKLSKTDFIEADDKIYVIGEPATVLANIFRREARRPMYRGVIAPGELEAEKVLMVLLETILGRSQATGKEVCFYSVPASAVDMDMDVIYHSAMFSKLIQQLGYKPVSLNEAAAIAYSNAAPENFSALAISCLTPGQKIITKRGFVDIESIVPGDQILTKAGLWASCSPTSRDYDGLVYSIKSYGNGSVEVTEDHKIWVGRNGTWQWIEAQNIQKGDLICQPWPNYSFKGRDRYLYVEQRITNSKEVKNVNILLTNALYELIGYFLGDGCIEYGDNDTSEGCGAGFTFKADDHYNIQRVRDLVKDVFDKDVAEYEHGDNAVRLKFYSKGFAKWLTENCYDFDKLKKVPFDIENINDSNLRFILKGLIETDGSYKNNHIGFSNTSPHLAQFVFLAMHRLGLSPSYICKEPRIGTVEVDPGRVIVGKKQCYEIQTTGLGAMDLIQWFKSPIATARKTTVYGSSVAYISEITAKHYAGKVYDVSVNGEDHSFCVPGIAVHNCGAGMINVCLMYQTIIGMSFSMARSGDWVDGSSAKSTGTTASRIQSIKEKGVDLLDASKGDVKTLREREAIVVYYKSLILYALDMIKKEFLKKQGTIDLPTAVPIILSGGTALAGNFLEFFKTAFDTVQDKFPIPVSEIRMASDPLNAVAQGLLVAALNYDESLK